MSESAKYSLRINAKNIGPHASLIENINIGTLPIKVGFFATNGSGKTAISRQLRLFTFNDEKLPLSDKFIHLGQDEGEFKFTISEANSSQSDSYSVALKKGEKPVLVNSTNLILHVFNRDYVRGSIEPNNYGLEKGISGYIIGQTEVDLNKEKVQEKSVYDKLNDVKEILIKNIKEAKLELRGLGVQHNTIELNQITLENLLANNSTDEFESFKHLKILLANLENLPEDLEDINSTLVKHIDTSNLKKILYILNGHYSYSEFADEFREKVQKKESLIKIGISHLKENDKTCPFCEQTLREKEIELISRYSEYLENEEAKIRESLNISADDVKHIRIILNDNYKILLKAESSYNKVKNYFPSFAKESLYIPNAPDDVINWSYLLDIIDIKRNFIRYNLTIEETIIVSMLIAGIEKYITNCDVFVKENELRIDTLNKQKRDTSKEILILRKRLCNAKSLQIKNSTTRTILEYKRQKSELDKISKSIKEMEEKVKKPKRTAISDTFSFLLKSVFGSKYTFNKENNSLQLNDHTLGKLTEDILSEGEKSLIAFCYYLAETHYIIDRETDYDKLLFVIDDPISSLDFHYTYTVCEILRNLNELFQYTDKRNLRIIIFTHNLEFMSILLRNNIILTRFSLIPNVIKKIPKELIMPYHEHLTDVYKVSKKIVPPSHTTPNSIRHILETISRFENPDPNWKIGNLILENDLLKECSLLHSLIQDSSHGIIRLQATSSSEDIIEAAEVTISFLESKYKGQIDYVERSV